jgi:hypothetical protein
MRCAIVEPSDPTWLTVRVLHMRKGGECDTPGFKGPKRQARLLILYKVCTTIEALANAAATAEHDCLLKPLGAK